VKIFWRRHGRLARVFSTPTRSLPHPTPFAQKFHEQDELWWDDGTAVREPIFDHDYIPLSEAVTPARSPRTELASPPRLDDKAIAPAPFFSHPARRPPLAFFPTTHSRGGAAARQHCSYICTASSF